MSVQMSLWQNLMEGGKRLFDSESAAETRALSRACAPDPRDVGFTAAVIGLGAKMAKADGHVCDEEVMVFSRVFRTAPEDAATVRRVFRLAQQTVRGYESYARKIARKYRDRPCLLEGVLDGLFMIAAADGVITEEEMVYLQTVSEAFGFDAADFRRIRASHFAADRDDPYDILGVAPDAEFEAIRRAYRRLMAANHPDRVVHNGAPREFEVTAHDKAAAITGAYARIRAERGLIAVN
jgi:DnaJ like chaperone protein